MNWTLPLSSSMEAFVAVRTDDRRDIDRGGVRARRRHVGDVCRQSLTFLANGCLNRPASTLSPGSDGVESGVVRIDYPASRFWLQGNVGPAVPLHSSTVGLPGTTDGREVEGAQQGRPSVSSLGWGRGVLVFAGRIGRADAEVKVSFRYQLLDGGRRLRAVEQVRGSGRDQDNVWIFERR